MSDPATEPEDTGADVGFPRVRSPHKGFGFIELDDPDDSSTEAVSVQEAVPTEDRPDTGGCRTRSW